MLALLRMKVEFFKFILQRILPVKSQEKLMAPPLVGEELLEKFELLMNIVYRLVFIKAPPPLRVAVQLEKLELVIE